VLSVLADVEVDIRDGSKLTHLHLACCPRGFASPVKLDIASDFDIEATRGLEQHYWDLRVYLDIVGWRYLVLAAKIRASSTPPFTTRCASSTLSFRSVRLLLLL